MFDSIWDTNPLLDEAGRKKVFGIQAYNAFDYKKKTSDCVSINNNDRQRLLKQQLRILLNMIPISFKELIFDEEDLDIFNPIEQLNGQCLCDYYLVKSEHVKKRISIQKSLNTRLGLFEKFTNENPQLRAILDEFGFV